jgi:AraC family transcriptional regulator
MLVRRVVEIRAIASSNKGTTMSTQNDQDFQIELEPPRFENGRALLVAGLRERAETNAAIPEQWQRAIAYQIPNQVAKAAYRVSFNTFSDTDFFECGLRK